MTEQYNEMAKVVSIIDDVTVVINRGLEHGLLLGDRYLIFDLGDELFDPDTNKSLGKLELVRGRAEVTHLQTNMATLRSYIQVSQGGTRKILRKSSGLGIIADMYGRSEEILEEPASELADIDAKVGSFAKKV